MPKKDELLDIGPVAETQTRATELAIVVEAGVLGREGVRDGGLANVLAVLAEEPFDAGLVRGTGGLGVSPAAEGAPLIEGQRMALLRGMRSGRRVFVASDAGDIGDIGDAGELGIDVGIDVGIGREVGVDVRVAGVAVVDVDVDVDIGIYIYIDIDDIHVHVDIGLKFDGGVAVVGGRWLLLLLLRWDADGRGNSSSSGSGDVTHSEGGNRNRGCDLVCRLARRECDCQPIE
ncbi:hypothetical protein F4859DRAFT_469188 [Xylaria cf. heliscus]|nr:hypothetical protein F4859DRAFT_469188 [Xylaria cf. heliscus]